MRLLTRPAVISKLEAITDNFRIITLEGDDLKDVAWIPGQKIEVFFDSHIPSTYTPISWDSVNGVIQLVVYGRGATLPGAIRVNTTELGEVRRLWGPRPSLDLTELKRPALFFGDETSIGLAHALRGTRDGLRDVAFLFEAWSPIELKQALHKLGVPEPMVLEHSKNEEDMTAMDATIYKLIDNLALDHFVLTGKVPSIRRVTKLLRRRRIPASKLLIMEYLANGETGFD